MARTKHRNTPKLSRKLSDEAYCALGLMETSIQHLFITGRAGTGKSTLLQHFQSTTKKKIVVVAPTGTAAVNVGGQTIHAFFRFRPGITVDDVKNLQPRDRHLYQKLDTVVIDEISMVRADLLDCMHAFLTLHGPQPGQPFGGVQMVLIGDVYQLPPVVPADELTLFTHHYRSPFFFDSHAFNLAKFHTIELQTVYRQHEHALVEILDAIRTASLQDDQLAKLNAHCATTGEGKTVTDELHPQVHQQVHLVTTNAMADTINDARLAKLPAQAVIFNGAVSGACTTTHLPTSERLTLKRGAAVMMLTNETNGHWVNGDLGVIEQIDPTKPGEAVRVTLENGFRGAICPYRWEIIRYEYDADKDCIRAKVVGTFTQYPLRLAWAVTIHKAQGKTFDRVLIDFGRGTFAHGQAYVALSRCTSFAGLQLTTPLERRHVFVDQRVTTFLDEQVSVETPAR